MYIFNNVISPILYGFYHITPMYTIIYRISSSLVHKNISKNTNNNNIYNQTHLSIDNFRYMLGFFRSYISYYLRPILISYIINIIFMLIFYSIYDYNYLFIYYQFSFIII